MKKIESCIAHAAEHLRDAGKRVAPFLAADVVAMLVASLRCHTARSLRSAVALVGRSRGGLPTLCPGA